MTGLIIDQKSAKTNSSTESGKSTEMEGKRSHLLVGVVTCLVSLVVFSAIVTSLYFGTHMCDSNEMMSEHHEKRLVSVSDSPKYAKVDIRKSERLIITESMSSDLKVDHTITLQDFNRDLQAVRDVAMKQCYVFPIYYTFEDAVAVATDKAISNKAFQEKTYVKMNRTKEAIPNELLQHAVGDNIASFCQDLPTYWLMHASTQDMHRARRFTITIRIDGVVIFTITL